MAQQSHGEKTEHTGGGDFLPCPMPQEGTHVRLGSGGLLSWTQCATQKARPLCEQKRDPSSHQTWGMA